MIAAPRRVAAVGSGSTFRAHSDHGNHAKKDSMMNDDERQIRELIRTWMAATKAGDSQAVLQLMTDDVVFLVPGRPPMRKEDFAKASSPSGGAPTFDGVSDIQEIVVAGEWAFAWTKLRVTVTPPGGAPPMVRSGPTLSVFRKQNGRWLLARDANLLAPEKATPSG